VCRSDGAALATCGEITKQLATTMSSTSSWRNAINKQLGEELDGSRPRRSRGWRTWRSQKFWRAQDFGLEGEGGTLLDFPIEMTCQANFSGALQLK
jgi:hypothetical protein